MVIADTIQSMYENVGEVYDTITNVEVNNGTNLLDYSTCKIGDLNTGTGAEETSTVRIISDFVEVTPNENYICTLIGGDYTTYYYKSDKTFISGGSSWIGSGNSFTTPNNTGYLRLKFKNTNNTTISLNDLSNVMLNKGSTALPYQPYTDNPTYKNIENIPSTIRKSYLDIMNNGIDKIWNNWEKVTGEGETLTLNSTEEAPMKIDLKGNTSQETTTGKNKLDLTGITTRTISAGITITPNFNGNILQNIRISGTPTTSAWQTLKRVTLEAGSYILTGINISDTSKTGLRIGVYIDSSRQYFINANSTTYSFTLAEQTTMGFVVWVQNVDYYPSGDIYITPMIRLSSVSDATYEPYTNGASPNPDYPQDIHVVSGDNSIKVCGKNLLNESTFEIGSIDAYTGQNVANNTEFRTSGYIKVNSSTNYTLSNQNYLTYTTRGIFEYDENKNYIKRTNNTTVSTSTGFYLTTTSNTKYVRIRYIVGSTISNVPTNMQIQYEKGTTQSTYEPYKGASYPINLGDIELCKIGDYQDYIYKENGNWYKHSEIKKIILNGGSGGSWSYPGANRFNLDNYITDYLKETYKITYLSDQYVPKYQTSANAEFNTATANLDYAFNFGSGTSNNIRFKDTRFTSVNDFKAELALHNLTIYYVLATPTYTEITDTTLLSQLEALNGAKSYTTQTNISQENNDKPFILDVTALKQLTQ